MLWLLRLPALTWCLRKHGQVGSGHCQSPHCLFAVIFGDPYLEVPRPTSLRRAPRRTKRAKAKRHPSFSVPPRSLRGGSAQMRLVA